MNDNEMTSGDQRAARESYTIPVIEEVLQIDKTFVDDGAVRLIKKVDETTVHVPLTTRREGYTIERIPVDQIVDQPPPAIRYEGSTIIISVVEEETIVQKRLRVVEEIRVTRTEEENLHEKEVILKKETIRVHRESHEPNQNR